MREVEPGCLGGHRRCNQTFRLDEVCVGARHWVTLHPYRFALSLVEIEIAQVHGALYRDGRRGQLSHAGILGAAGAGCA